MEVIEYMMFQLSGLFMVPILLLLALLFAYSLFALGDFMWQFILRRRNQWNYREISHNRFPTDVAQLKGYPLATLIFFQPTISRDELDIAALEELETVRTVSRLAPMLGLIATMVPMGPALKSLADGNIQGISENLIVAFSAVIFGLVIASITFWIASVKKRWLAAELVAFTKQMDNSPGALR